MATKPVRLSNFYVFNSNGVIAEQNLHITGVGFYSANTTSFLEITASGTSLCIMAKENVNIPSWQFAPIDTIVSNVSALTVTACTGWLYLGV